MKKNSIMRGLAAGLVMATTLAGCGASDNKNQAEEITLTFFDKNTGAGFSDPVAEEITKKTGIKVEIQQPTGNPG